MSTIIFHYFIFHGRIALGTIGYVVKMFLVGIFVAKMSTAKLFMVKLPKTTLVSCGRVCILVHKEKEINGILGLGHIK